MAITLRLSKDGGRDAVAIAPLTTSSGSTMPWPRIVIPSSTCDMYGAKTTLSTNHYGEYTFIHPSSSTKSQFLPSSLIVSSTLTNHSPPQNTMCATHEDMSLCTANSANPRIMSTKPSSISHEINNQRNTSYMMPSNPNMRHFDTPLTICPCLLWNSLLSLILSYQPCLSYLIK